MGEHRVAAVNTTMTMREALAGGWCIEFKPRRKLEVRAPDGTPYRRARSNEGARIIIQPKDASLPALFLVPDGKADRARQGDLFPTGGAP